MRRRFGFGETLFGGNRGAGGAEAVGEGCVVGWGGVALQERERRGGERKKEKNGGGNTEVSKPSVTSDHPPLP